MKPIGAVVQAPSSVQVKIYKKETCRIGMSYAQESTKINVSLNMPHAFKGQRSVPDKVHS